MQTILTQAEADKYGDPALGIDRPIVWSRGVPYIIRDIRKTTPTIGDVLVLAIKGKHGSRILFSRPDSLLISERLRAGDRDIEIN